MILRFAFLAGLITFISCSKSREPLTFVSEKVSIEEVRIDTQLALSNELPINGLKASDLIELQNHQSLYLNNNQEFSLTDFSTEWSEKQKYLKTRKLNPSELELWFDITALLFQLSGEAMYAEELNNIVLKGIGENHKENINIVSPYIFTKDVDNLFVNIFTPSTINYDHTTMGNVNVEMQTGFPNSGKVDLKFGMTERRYIEVNIRIPSWADNASVTVKKVKYVAPPGSYCKIAKKWKEGDLIEVQFPIEKMPDYRNL